METLHGFRGKCNVLHAWGLNVLLRSATGDGGTPLANDGTPRVFAESKEHRVIRPLSRPSRNLYIAMLPVVKADGKWFILQNKPK